MNNENTSTQHLFFGWFLNEKSLDCTHKHIVLHQILCSILLLSYTLILLLLFHLLLFIFILHSLYSVFMFNGFFLCILFRIFFICVLLLYLLLSLRPSSNTHFFRFVFFMWIIFRYGCSMHIYIYYDTWQSKIELCWSLFIRWLLVQKTKMNK